VKPTCLSFGWLLSVIVASISIRAADVTLSRTNYHGWGDAWRIQNRTAEVFVVPSVGRILQFRFLGENEGPLWENPQLLGKPMMKNPWETAVGSFGGDKTWPAPQSAWNWPPPDVFDASPLEAHAEGGALRMLSPVSPRFGIRTERILTLDPAKPILRVVTIYRKVAGEPVEVGVWVITQTRVPEAAFLPQPANSKFADGLTRLWALPTNFISRPSPGLIEFRRDARESHKIGNDGEAILWVGAKQTLKIEISRVPGATYPDDGCSVELYSNPDPAGYVEMEALGPLKTLRVGDELRGTNLYTLGHRQNRDVVAEARHLLSH
jgi:hypothetical protein